MNSLKPIQLIDILFLSIVTIKATFLPIDIHITQIQCALETLYSEGYIVCLVRRFCKYNGSFCKV